MKGRIDKYEWYSSNMLDIETDIKDPDGSTLRRHLRHERSSSDSYPDYIPH